MKQDIKKITIDQLFNYYNTNNMGDIYVIDSRPLIEYEKNSLNDAVHLDANADATKMYEEYPDELDSIIYDKKIILIIVNHISSISKAFLLLMVKFKKPIKICINYDKFYEKYKKHKELFKIPKLKRHQMSEIITKFLYLGNQQDSEDYELLKKKGITHIINATSHIKNSFPTKFKYLRVPILDTKGQNISKYFEETYNFIEQARNMKGRVFIHCFMGVSISATLTIAYIMKKHFATADSTIAVLRTKRSIINPNRDFYQHLLKYEKYLIQCRINASVNNQTKTKTLK